MLTDALAPELGYVAISRHHELEIREPDHDG